MREPTISTPLSSESASPEFPRINENTLLVVAPFALTIFLSAFLLFQVQPLIAKQILPWFGGAAAVWSTCMLFFQITLLVGYLYAHWITRSLQPRTQAMLHIGLLSLSVLSLPVIPNPWWKPADLGDPLPRILGLLAATIGLPYFLLSSTSPLLQAWMARNTSKSVPYRLFALSNLGSMLALVSYPVVVEPYLAGSQQAWIWSSAYIAFAALCGFTAFRMRGVFSLVSLRPTSPAGRFPSRLDYAVWGALAACASALLLAVTEHLTENVASIPFLWIIPLAIYLLSFILCFDSPAWYRRVIFLPLLAVALGALAYSFAQPVTKLPFAIQIAGYAVCLFICCMVCHGELARTKPDPAHLTGFYLMISIGGAAGGLFVALAAPRLFDALYEFPISLVCCALVVLVVCYRTLPSALAWNAPSRIAFLCALVGTAALTDYLFLKTREAVRNPVLLVRNFYGALRVNDYPQSAEQEAVRQLTHGTINHGEQFLNIFRRREPTTYYGRKSGIGRAIEELQRHGPLRVGVIGLGTGTIAAYGQPGDLYKFYEINPLIVGIARHQFTYLSDSAAKIEIELGDARLTLEREPPQDFDLLAVDAFSGDSIPVHLLTREAFALYLRNLKPDGVLAIHVSNHYLQLAPVVKQEASVFSKPALLIGTEADDDAGTSASDWVLVSMRPGFAELLKSASSKIETKRGLRAWTDDYSNLWQILK